MKCNADASKEGLISDAGQIKLTKEQHSVFYKADHGELFIWSKINGNNTQNSTSEELSCKDKTEYFYNLYA